ncbi:hypothetical protein DH2020_018359 [Rehmannia glutinosa]|uniref:Beta-glucosidase n=1 Tax=Rehmannia glutinosa TaxID=99300 RepID=A0ABR0WM95_REHGL
MAINNQKSTICKLNRHDFPDDFLFGAASSAYQEDVALMKKMGLDTYRHDFAEYANVCFFEFGDRVKHWITINESWTYTHNGYVTAAFPPAHGSPSEQPIGNGVANGVARYRSAPVVDNTHIGGNAATEPYKVAHHLILAHARAVDIYRRKYQAVQGGIIGVTNMTTWYDPYSDLPQDIEAAKRAVDFMWGWFVEPIVTGDYPKVMRDRVKERLPVFKPEEEKLVKGSYDFIGMNYYTSNWCAYKPKLPSDPTTYYTDQEVEFYRVDEKNHKHLPVIAALEDDDRIEFHEQHLAYMKQAME